MLCSHPAYDEICFQLYWVLNILWILQRPQPSSVDHFCMLQPQGMWPLIHCLKAGIPTALTLFMLGQAGNWKPMPFILVLIHSLGQFTLFPPSAHLQINLPCHTPSCFCGHLSHTTDRFISNYKKVHPHVIDHHSCNSTFTFFSLCMCAHSCV